MNEKRYQLRHEDLDYPCYSDLVDTEDNDRVICTFNNDSGTNKMVVLLNEQNKTIKELWRENKSYMSDAIKFEKECKRLYNNLRLTNSDLCSEKIMHNHCKKKNEQLKREKERYKQLSEIRNENINNRILTLKEFINNCKDEKVKNALEDLFYSEVKEYDLAKENRELKKENEKLKKEKEYWKGNACNYSNYLSILSMDCHIVQEVILDLKKVIDVDTEAFKLLDELDDKFDELNEHRIRVRYG